MLIYEKYRGIKLTDKGISIAIVIRNRYGLLFEFFKLIGVTEQPAANKYTEGFKHHLHPESIYKVEKLVKYYQRKSEFIMLVYNAGRY